MSTLTIQLSRLLKSFGQVEKREDEFQKAIPKDVLEGTVGVMFFKKLARGKVQNMSGIFMDRDGLGWSNPVAIQINKGDMYLGHAAKADVLILITEENKSKLFQSAGLMRFSDETNKLGRGRLVFGDRAKRKTRTNMEVVHSCCYAITRGAIRGGEIISAHLSDATIKVKDSSNRKFYKTKNGSIRHITTNVDDPEYMNDLAMSVRVVVKNFFGRPGSSAHPNPASKEKKRPQISRNPASNDSHDSLDTVQRIQTTQSSSCVLQKTARPSTIEHSQSERVIRCDSFDFS